MRRRTPSEIKAYGDGYAEAYKEFCHLLKNHDVDKAMRKMKIFADAVALTVETATDEPQTEECPFDDAIPCEWVCTEYGNCKYKQKTEPQTVDWKDEMWAEAVKEEPQTCSFGLHMDCSLCWKESHCRAIKEAERSSE